MSDLYATLDAIPRDHLPAAIARLAARAMEPAPMAEPPDVQRDAATADPLLTPDEVAALLKTDRRFVYRHARDLGGVHLSRRKLRFPARKVRRYLERAR